MTETELLFTGILNCDRLYLYQNPNILLDREKTLLLSRVLKRRISGEPVQYILGKTEFMGLDFLVNPNVLIPRPETEILVEKSIKYVARPSPDCAWDKQGHKDTCKEILELGTGSGCIAVSLQKYLSNSKITATDISEAALEIARNNARLHNVSINFVLSDCFSAYSLKLKAYDLIISNPPYVTSGDIDKLQPEVRHEPRIALDGGEDGLHYYRKIIKESPAYLKESGLLMMEIGFGQEDYIKKILENSGNFEIIEVVKDYNNIDRVIVAKGDREAWIN